MKAIVIGSGMSGLTAAAYLVQAGHAVTIYEQFPTPGGVTTTLKQDGYNWDLGPLLLEGFGPGDRARRILEELGVSDQVPVIPADRGLVLNDLALWKPVEYQGPYWRRERLKKEFPEDAPALDRYYHFYDQILDLVSLARQSQTATGLTRLLRKVQLALVFQKVRAKRNWTASQLMDHYFHREEIKTILTGIVADFVTKPSEFPALGVPLIHLETAFDQRIPVEPGATSARSGWNFIRGGCDRLVQAVLGAVTGSGGQVITSTIVERIVIKDGQAQGVEVNGRFEPADLVIASGGATDTFFGLVGHQHLPAEMIKDLEACRYMESVLMVHLGIDFNPIPYQPAALCYYYLTTDLAGGIDRLRAGIFHAGREGFLIYVPSLHSPEMAPVGHHAVTIYTIAPDRLAEGDWTEQREELADQLVAEAERYMPGLRAHTLTRLILTPNDFRQRTHLGHHSFGGAPPILGNKPPKHRTPIQRLWFVGAQSISGGGVQNVMLGAAQTVKAILKEDI